MSSRMFSRVAVVGAGVIGLSTAVHILESQPGVTVTLIADKFSPQTTGDGAAGFWEPHVTGDTDEKLIRYDCFSYLFPHILCIIYPILPYTALYT